jgi:hypothetical protein
VRQVGHVILLQNLTVLLGLLGGFIGGANVNEIEIAPKGVEPHKEESRNDTKSTFSTPNIPDSSPPNILPDEGQPHSDRTILPDERQPHSDRTK